MKPLVGIIMGSSSDWETMRAAAEALDKLGVPYETRVVSAHRTPDLLFEYAAQRPGPRHRSDHRRCRRRRPSTGHDGLEDHAAGARRSGAVEGAERPGLTAVHRADAGRHSGGHVRDRRWPAPPTRDWPPPPSSPTSVPRSTRRSRNSAANRRRRCCPIPIPANAAAQ